MGKILLINKGWSDNIGDQAIKYTLERLIESHGHKCEFADLTKPKTAEGKTGGSPSALKRFLKPVIAIIPDALGQIAWLLKYWPIFRKQFKQNDYDLVIIGGGQLILNNASFPLAVYIWMQLLKGVHKNKVVFYGVGSSTELTALDKMLYKSSLGKADEVVLRDSTSIRYIDDEFGIKAQYTPDVVFNISKYIKKESRPCSTVLIAPPSFEVYCLYQKNNPDKMNAEAYETYWETAVRVNSKEGTCVKLFYTAEQDIEQTEKLQRAMVRKHGMEIELLCVSDIHDYIRELGGAAKVISGRMHALIIAYSFGKTLQVFPLSKKLTTFEDEYLNQSKTLESIQASIESTFGNLIACHIS